MSSPQPSKHRKSAWPSMMSSRKDDIKTVPTHELPTTVIAHKPQCCDARQEHVDGTKVSGNGNAATHYSNDKHDLVRPQVIPPSQQCKDQMSYSDDFLPIAKQTMHVSYPTLVE